MTMTFYVIDSTHKNTDGTYERVETTRGTPQGLEDYINRLNNDSTCVTFEVSEKKYNSFQGFTNQS